ncbi:phosphotransferase [Inconstantimicrobium mannanitabidum]|uniref:Aminoglycoside phosphotransferase n=1 Tax=Inconstantimicrobium mannanitabidum TaxID=1604901 RepID=A0ACB5R7J7_9CLOT|nr:phosphotransferase [Clostridium sp. TW13]GKX64984.1 aminoglycoside phosphotransferase [Clostridium sp. TW13]
MNSLLGKCIGQGGCAEVFEWGEDRAIKLFRSNIDEYAVNKEYNNMVVAWKSGLPTYRPYERIDLDGRLGIIYERIIGQSFMERFIQEDIIFNDMKSNLTEEDKKLLDCKDNDIRTTARILYEIHQKSIDGMPNQIEDIKGNISRPAYLSEEEKCKIYNYIDTLPIKNCLCHGDPNPGNFIMRDDKPVIIDWMDAATGNPAADIAQYVIMMRYAVLPPETPQNFVNYLHLIREFVIDMFLDEYMKISGMKYEEIQQWMLPMIAAKLHADAICDEEKKTLINVLREKLKYIS